MLHYVNGCKHQRDFYLKSNRFLLFESSSTLAVGVNASDEGPDMVKVTTAGRALCPRPWSGSHFLTACHHIWTVTAHYHQSEQRRRERDEEESEGETQQSSRTTSEHALFQMVRHEKWRNRIQYVAELITNLKAAGI